MIISLESVFECITSELPVNCSFDFSAYEFGGAFPFIAPVVLNGFIRNSADIVTLEARATVKYSGSCDRCACDIEREFIIPVSHTLVNELNNDDNDELILVENMQLEIDRLTLEDIYLYLPTRILCSESCKGICQQCGQNLNNGICGCEKPTDPRLAALRQLLGEN